ncbi:MAG: 16S rRNA (adenine(1518)-N(6)/adenine(1519)-N(6))-dimethyltransferase RsmA [Bacteroidales bacterium]|nr:16S rRNA (adenine(1518)-N(6)/adenine(1519)-N(6))-dimethyltransferase RsmA [Bacteroidales bacterium]
MKVRAKKHLGQHFLNDEDIAKKIVDSLDESTTKVLEVGPGMGVLTKYLLQKDQLETHVVEIDDESVAFLKANYPALSSRIIEKDMLKLKLEDHFEGSFSLIGNFPYNISSQILFKVLDYKDQIPEVVGMFQKEVAERIAEGPGSKTYGIISVLLQAYYDIEYLFTVHEDVFTPPPKVKSAVIRLRRNKTANLGCDEKLFKSIVKTAFNQRRKTLRNSIKSLIGENTQIPAELLAERPEQLSVEQFITLTKYIQE